MDQNELVAKVFDGDIPDDKAAGGKGNKDEVSI